MINWFLRSKVNSSVNLLNFKNSEGSKLNIIIDIDNDNNVKCNMSFFKHDRIADISELNLKEIL
jgi:hypothetical protein